MLVCDNCGKVAEQNHCKTEVSSMRDCKGFEAKIDLCEDCFDNFNAELLNLVNSYQRYANTMKLKKEVSKNE